MRWSMARLAGDLLVYPIHQLVDAVESKILGVSLDIAKAFGWVWRKTLLFQVTI